MTDTRTTRFPLPHFLSATDLCFSRRRAKHKSFDKGKQKLQLAIAVAGVSFTFSPKGKKITGGLLPVVVRYRRFRWLVKTPDEGTTSNRSARSCGTSHNNRCRHGSSFLLHDTLQLFAPSYHMIAYRVQLEPGRCPHRFYTSLAPIIARAPTATIVPAGAIYYFYDSSTKYDINSCSVHFVNSPVPPTLRGWSCHPMPSPPLPPRSRPVSGSASTTTHTRGSVSKRRSVKSCGYIAFRPTMGKRVLKQSPP